MYRRAAVLFKLGLFAAFLAIQAQGVHAAALVLVQGYLGDGDGWRESGVTRTLEKAGWANGGRLWVDPGGLVRGQAPARQATRYYTLALPTEAPLMVQVRFLEAYLDDIRKRHPDETLALAGHSAGGVVARLYMVRHPDAGVDALVTIASPHLGTDKAELGLMAGQSPLAWVAPLVGGGTLNRSQGLYQDLTPRPGGILHWLNFQAHPRALYVSVVRNDDSLFGLGDVVVPARSQDMNQVYGLRGRSRRVETEGGHGIQAGDGDIILRAVRELDRS